MQSGAFKANSYIIKKFKEIVEGNSWKNLIVLYE